MTCQGSNLPKVTQLSGVRSWDSKNLLLPQSSALPTEAALPPCTYGNNNNTTHEQVIPSEHQVIPEEGWMNSYVVNSRSWSSSGLPMNREGNSFTYSERRKKDKGKKKDRSEVLHIKWSIIIPKQELNQTDCPKDRAASTGTQFLKCRNVSLTWLTLLSLQGVLVALNIFLLLLWRQEQTRSPKHPLLRSWGEEEEVNTVASWELSDCVCHQGMPFPNAWV